MGYPPSGALRGAPDGRSRTLEVVPGEAGGRAHGDRDRAATAAWLRLRTRLLVGLPVVGPVSLLGLLPVGLGLDRYVLDTPTMEPAISRGSVLLERRVPVAALQVGDVITFRPPAASADAA